MNKINQGNAQLMSLVLVLGLAMMAAPRGIEMMAQQQSERVWDVTASQFNTVQMAARQYISDNLDTLATQVKPARPVYVSVNTLKTTGHLPAGFGANDHNQNYLIAVVSNPKMTGQLQADSPGILARFVIFQAIYRDSEAMSGLTIRRLVPAVDGK